MPVDLLDGLKRSRAGTRAAVTRTVNRLCEPRTGEVSLEDVEVDVEYLVARKAALQDLDSQILALTGEEQYDQEVQGILECEQQLIAAITRARRVLRTAGQLTSPVAPSAALCDSTPRESTSRSVSLPKLQIPKFGGKLQDWARFWEHFQATIHNNGALATVEKFKYLLCYVTDEAKRAIDGISLSGANYQIAVDALKQRFGRTDLLAAEHIDKLLSLRAVQGSGDVTQLRHLFDEVSRHTRALESLEIPQSCYDVVLYRVVTRCLPPDLFVLFRQRRKELASPSESALHRVYSHVAHCRGAAALPAGVRTDSTRPDGAPPAPPSDLPSCALCHACGHRTATCPAPLTPEGKRRSLTSARRCFRCAKRKYLARQCRSSASLTCTRCHGQHLTVLCDIQPKRETRERTARSVGSASASPAQTPEIQATTASTSSTVTFLQTAVVQVAGPGGSASVRILLDNGSQRTFITKELAQRLRCPGLASENMSIFAFGSTQPSTHRAYQKVSLRIDGLHQSLEVEAIAIPQICRSLSPPVDGRILQMLHDRGLSPVTTTCLSQNVDVLVGTDYYWRFVSGRIERLPNNITAVETVFGWIVQGVAPLRSSLPDYPATTSLLCCTNDAPEHELTNLWRLDALGIMDSDVAAPTGAADLQMFQENIKWQTDRYEVPLMIQAPGLPPEAHNRVTAETRLNAQLRRFRMAPDVLKQYDATMREYFVEGHAEPVSGPDPTRNVYYLPHHAVIRMEAVTTKVRIVFDASSHVPGQPSLNEVLSKGPNLKSNLLHLLITFRSSPIVLTADIRKAYLQIQIRPEDRDALRFLWGQELPSSSNPYPATQEWRMTRVPFGASSSPFLLAATLHHHFAIPSHRSSPPHQLLC
ncbi:uncharacterized protein LOC135387252 [Ornithodoros turicata]|uniref:uncharacterized protein LOC135387252 n=1 Tax=Ornithodoros turicata TaxID=34597 RepID=UPI0031394706